MRGLSQKSKKLNAKTQRIYAKGAISAIEIREHLCIRGKKKFHLPPISKKIVPLPTKKKKI